MEFSFKKEINRKLIHLSSLIYPLSYHFFDKKEMISILLILFLIVFTWDLLRIRSLESKLLKFLHVFLRHSEINNKKFTGATWFMLSFLIVTIFFPRYIAVLSMVVLIIGDTFAALIGKKYGKTKIFNKSLEGLIAFIVSSLLVSYGYIFALDIELPLEHNIFLILAIIIAAFAELISKHISIDDNLIIPIIFASILQLGL